MPAIRVVLVEPKNDGNVGAVARAMRNFDVAELVLVKPCTLGEEARRRAMHGVGILESARTVETLDAAIKGADLIVGTSGIDTRSEKRFTRIAVTPEELAARIAPLAGTVALLFGREDFGLFNEELLRCDLLVTIPASTEYSILNVSHAAAIVLYELFAVKASSQSRLVASGFEKEALHRAFDALLDATNYPAHKRDRTKVMFRRLVGRAVPSKWDFHALMGVLERARKRIRRLEGKR